MSTVGSSLPLSTMARDVASDSVRTTEGSTGRAQRDVTTIYSAQHTPSKQLLGMMAGMQPRAPKTEPIVLKTRAALRLGRAHALRHASAPRELPNSYSQRRRGRQRGVSVDVAPASSSAARESAAVEAAAVAAAELDEPHGVARAEERRDDAAEERARVDWLSPRTEGAPSRFVGGAKSGHIFWIPARTRMWQGAHEYA
jgi:hypothetical protein